MENATPLHLHRCSLHAVSRLCALVFAGAMLTTFVPFKAYAGPLVMQKEEKIYRFVDRFGLTCFLPSA